MKITDYGHVGAYELDQVVTGVKAAIDEGWQPFGELTTWMQQNGQEPAERWFQQTIVKYSEE